MITATHGVLDCHPDADKIVVRQRATKVRRQCTDCQRIGRWETLPGKVHPQPDIPVKVNTHDGGTYWKDAPVTDLRAMCKKKGLTGYSKMKRDDLVAMLSDA